MTDYNKLQEEDGLASPVNARSSILSRQHHSTSSKDQKWKPSLGKSTSGKKLAETKEAILIHGLARAMLGYGAPLYRIENRIHDAAEALNLPVSISCLPSIIYISIGNPGDLYPTQTYFLKYGVGYNMAKLYDVDQLSRSCFQISANEYKNINEDMETAETILTKLDLIVESQFPYQKTVSIFAAASQSFFISLLLYQGSIPDSLISFLLGIVTGLVNHFL